jgi:hypothetical protein
MGPKVNSLHAAAEHHAGPGPHGLPMRERSE